jgi:hypothetical protein
MRGGANSISSDPKSKETTELLQLVNDLAAEVQDLNTEHSTHKNRVKDLAAAFEVHLGVDLDDKDGAGRGATRVLKKECIVAALVADTLDYAIYFTVNDIDWSTGCDKCSKGWKQTFNAIPSDSGVGFWSECK